MRSGKLVSIIVPCYNDGVFLSEALNSLLLQEYTLWECIIVDDGSVDSTKEVALKYCNEDKRFRYIYQTNKGLSVARNTGIKNAHGDYLQLLDADDIMICRKIAHQIDYLEAHSEVDLIYSEVRYFRSESPSILSRSIDMKDTEWMPAISGKGSIVLETLVGKNIMVCNSPLIRKKVVDVIGLFDETLRSLEDWDYWLRVAMNDFYFYFDNRAECYALVRSRAGSMQSNYNRMNSAKFLIRRKISRQFKNDPDKSALFTINKKRYITELEMSIFQNMPASGAGSKIKHLWKNISKNFVSYFYFREGVYLLFSKLTKSFLKSF